MIKFTHIFNTGYYEYDIMKQKMVKKVQHEYIN